MRTAYGHWWEDFFYLRSRGRNVAMADGRIEFLLQRPSPDWLSARLTIDDGSRWDHDESLRGWRGD
jgi:hypothetical protein